MSSQHNIIRGKRNLVREMVREGPKKSNLSQMTSTSDSKSDSVRMHVTSLFSLMYSRHLLHLSTHTVHELHRVLKGPH